MPDPLPPPQPPEGARSSIVEMLERLAYLEKMTTTGPWVLGSPNRYCTKPSHSTPLGHPGTRGDDPCVYGFHGFLDGEYFGRFVSSEPEQCEIIGSTDYGPMLELDDARFIAAARNAIPTLLALARLAVEARPALGWYALHAATEGKHRLDDWTLRFDRIAEGT